jgi:hypothetical protein
MSAMAYAFPSGLKGRLIIAELTELPEVDFRLVRVF